MSCAGLLVPHPYFVAFSNKNEYPLYLTKLTTKHILNLFTIADHYPMSMSYEFATGYKIRDQSATHFLTFTIMGWIDIFSRPRYRELILKSFQFCRAHKGLHIGAYVIMTNHIHTIWTATQHNLSDVMRDFKTFTSKAISQSIEEEPESRREWLQYMFNFYANRTNANRHFKVWTSNNHPEEIHSDGFLKTKLQYIHDNPVRAGWVKEPGQYLYSSAADYAGGKGIMDIDLLF